MAWLCVAVTAVSFLTACLGAKAAIFLSIQWQSYEQPGPRKLHDMAMPNMGWLAMLLGGMISLGMVGIAMLVPIFKVMVGEELYSGMLRKIPMSLGVGLGALGSLALGWLDDKTKLSPWPKIAGQLLLGLLLYVLGVRITLFVGGMGTLFFTLAWTLCVMNAFNLLDNLDGACAGVALIACLIFLAVALILRQWFIALLLSAFAGALAGFLVFNFPPAKIFMGNAGASFVGYTMAAMTMLETFYKKGVPSHLAVVLPLMLLALPAYDTLSVMLIRLRRGAPLSVGDMNHFSHRLLRRGFSPRQAVLMLYAVTAVIGCAGLTLPFVSTPMAMGMLLFCAAILAGLGVWEAKA